MQAELEEAWQASYQHHSNAAQIEIQAVQRNQYGLQAELDTIKEAKAREEEQRREEIEQAMGSLPKRPRSGMHGSDSYHPMPPYVGAGQGGSQVSQVSQDNLSQFVPNVRQQQRLQWKLNHSQTPTVDGWTRHQDQSSTWLCRRQRVRWIARTIEIWIKSNSINIEYQKCSLCQILFESWQQ
jgi:hypothetical protein